MDGLTDASSVEPTWLFLKILFPGYFIFFSFQIFLSFFFLLESVEIYELLATI